MYRTHFVGELSKESVGQVVTVNGWVHSYRNLGGVLFVDLRDRSGLVQIVFNPDISKEASELAETLRSEYVISVTGKVVARSPETVNPKLATGEIEILGEKLHIFNPAKTPPFEIQDQTQVDETLRLKYRYLDLRRPKMQETLIIRHKAMQAMRRFLDRHGFVELETPMLTKSTPEGARDYLVPSRVHPGKFYALPQSPQIFKQLFMVAGMERYYQFARCFRDEDLRADRQPEFTQLDIEVSFMSVDHLFHLMEQMFANVFREVLNVEIPTPFPRLTYQEAMERYGTDKPDTRFGMELIDLTEVFAGTSFQVFANTIAGGGQIKAIKVEGKAGWSRKEIDQWGQLAQKLGAKGLAWLAWKEEGVKGSIAKFLTEQELSSVQNLTKASTGDLLFFVADKPAVVAKVLGELRLRLGKELGLIDESKFNFLWVTEFPLLEYSEEDGRYYAQHHPFTSPVEEDIPLLDTDPGKVRAQAYDLVLNGYELSSGSQRIYQRDLQEKIFQVLKITEEEAKEKFGFLLEAFEYGAPPHLGIAFGIDRIVMIMAGQNNLRECIPFPKTNSAACLMTDAPSEVSEEQLEELHIQVN
jgi:aspartyl-tRNA synthetase